MPEPESEKVKNNFLITKDDLFSHGHKLAAFCLELPRNLICFIFELFQSLKRKERDLEHEMERLARDKIALQQRLQLMKKDMAGQWDQLDWRMAPDGVDLDCRRSPTSTETTATLSPDRMLLENRYSESSDSSSPTNNMNGASRQDMELDDSESDSQHPLSLTVNNCHIS